MHSAGMSVNLAPVNNPLIQRALLSSMMKHSPGYSSSGIVTSFAVLALATCVTAMRLQLPSEPIYACT